MVLADWVFDAAITVSSPTDSPFSPPHVRETATGNATNTRETYFGTPVGNNVNGIAVNNIQQGQIETFIRLNVSAAQASTNRVAAVLACRYTDVSNYYNLRFWADYNTGGTSSGFIIEKRKAGVDSVIASGSLTTNIAASPIYYKMRFTWWVAGGVWRARAELSADGGSTWVQQGSDVADSENFNTGSTVKVGAGVEIGLNNSISRDCLIDFDGTAIRSA